MDLVASPEEVRASASLLASAVSPPPPPEAAGAVDTTVRSRSALGSAAPSAATGTAAVVERQGSATGGTGGAGHEEAKDGSSERESKDDNPSVYFEKLKADELLAAAIENKSAEKLLGEVLALVDNIRGVSDFWVSFVKASPAEVCPLLRSVAEDSLVAPLLSSDKLVEFARAKRHEFEIRASAGAAAAAGGAGVASVSGDVKGHYGATGNDGQVGWTMDMARAFGALLRRSRHHVLVEQASKAAQQGAAQSPDATSDVKEDESETLAGCVWDPMFRSPGIDVKEGGRGSGAILSKPLPREGVHQWRVEIVSGAGNCMTVGVGRSSALGSNHNITGLHAGGSIIEVFHGGQKVTSPEWSPGLSGSYKLKSGTTVQVEANMDTRKLRMWVNGKPTGVIVESLPFDICPAVSLRQVGLSARLTDSSGLPPTAGTR